MEKRIPSCAMSLNPTTAFRDALSKPPSIQFQILSDLHLEAGQQYSSLKIPVTAPYLILAGDIGRLIDHGFHLGFLERQIEHDEKVFLVFGNYEFYGISFAVGIYQAMNLESAQSLKGKLVLLRQIHLNIPDSPSHNLGMCPLVPKRG